MVNFKCEIKWKVEIPLLSWLCPNDKCKVIKYGDQMKLDTTFVDFKGLRTIRNPNTFMLKKNTQTNNFEILKSDNKKKRYYNFYETLDEEEQELVINDLMQQSRFSGSFKILQCVLTESKSFLGNNDVYEIIDGKKAKKFELNLKVRLDNHPTECITYYDLNENNYLDLNNNIIKKREQIKIKELTQKFKDNLHIKNEQFAKNISELEKEKKLKAYVWIIDNSHINDKEGLELLNILAPANEFFDKVREFFHHPDIQAIVNKNGFPVKIQIPYNIFIDFTIIFKHFKLLNLNDVEGLSMFDYLKDFKLEPRKIVENIKENYKIRAKYSNIR